MALLIHVILVLLEVIRMKLVHLIVNNALLDALVILLHHPNARLVLLASSLIPLILHPVMLVVQDIINLHLNNHPVFHAQLDSLHLIMQLFYVQLVPLGDSLISLHLLLALIVYQVAFNLPLVQAAVFLVLLALIIVNLLKVNASLVHLDEQKTPLALLFVLFIVALDSVNSLLERLLVNLVQLVVIRFLQVHQLFLVLVLVILIVLTAQLDQSQIPQVHSVVSCVKQGNINQFPV
jgi:hypothetical protein